MISPELPGERKNPVSVRDGACTEDEKGKTYRSDNV